MLMNKNVSKLAKTYQKFKSGKVCNCLISLNNTIVIAVGKTHIILI